jgi:hypothetical protein
MEHKLNYLREYNEEICLVSGKEVRNIKEGLIPEVWREIFNKENINDRKEALLNLWRKYIGTELHNTIAYLSEFLEEIEVMECNNIYSILYTVRNPNGDVLYYEGRNPQDEFENSELEKHWDKVSVSLKSFYQNVHNGFYYYASESMGLVPIASVTYLGDDDLEWSIIDELKEPMQIDLNTSFGFFSNGMGSYVVIDVANCEENNATFWSAKTQPKYNISFWRYVDEWIVIGFQG